MSAPTVSAAKRTDSRDKRPAQIVFGATISFPGGFLFILAGVVLMLVPPELLAQVPPRPRVERVLIIAGTLLIIVALGNIGIALR